LGQLQSKFEVLLGGGASWGRANYERVKVWSNYLQFIVGSYYDSSQKRTKTKIIWVKIWVKLLHDDHILGQTLTQNYMCQTMGQTIGHIIGTSSVKVWGFGSNYDQTMTFLELS